VSKVQAYILEGVPKAAFNLNLTPSGLLVEDFVTLDLQIHVITLGISQNGFNIVCDRPADPSANRPRYSLTWAMF